MSCTQLLLLCHAWRSSNKVSYWHLSKLACACPIAIYIFAIGGAWLLTGSSLNTSLMLQHVARHLERVTTNVSTDPSFISLDIKHHWGAVVKPTYTTSTRAGEEAALDPPNTPAYTQATLAPLAADANSKLTSFVPLHTADVPTSYPTTPLTPVPLESPSTSSTLETSTPTSEGSTFDPPKFRCTYVSCSRHAKANGFKRKDNLRTHLRNVHGDSIAKRKGRRRREGNGPSRPWMAGVDRPDPRAG